MTEQPIFPHVHAWGLWQTNFSRGTYTYRCLTCPAEIEQTVPCTPHLRKIPSHAAPQHPDFSLQEPRHEANGLL